MLLVCGYAYNEESTNALKQKIIPVHTKTKKIENSACRGIESVEKSSRKA